MKSFTTLFFAILLFCTISIFNAQQLNNEKDKILNLELGKPIERELLPTEIHTYPISLKAGDFLRGVVDQRGVDVVVEAYNPSGEKIFEVDSPNGTMGPEPIDFEAKISGLYKIEIHSLEKEAPKGRYEIRINEILNKDQYAVYLEKERIKREEFLEKEKIRLEAAKNWISKNAIHLKTVESGNGFEDMQPLKKIIGNAHIVSLGEATHGTREFFQLKHRMLEFLVNEMGFTVFCIEATMPECFDINEFVLTGKGDPVKALSGIYFWTWNTEEVLDMILWMRKYNADPNHIKKVKFYGFDMQSASRAAKVTLDYLRKVDLERDLKMEKTMEMLANPYIAQDFTSTTFESLSKEIKETNLTSVNQIVNRFDERKQEYIKRTDANNWALARQHACILVQYIRMVMTPQGVYPVRDSSMAENISWILKHEGPDAKIVVWAHNAHVATDSTSFMKWMGHHLRKKFGSDMVVFGFAFNQGSFNSRELPFPSEKGVHSFTVGPAKEGSLDSTLAAAGLQTAAINLHELPQAGLIREWFNTPKGTRNYGSGYRKEMENNFFGRDIIRLYDGLLFVEKTSAAIPNPGGRRLGSQKLTIPSNLDFEISNKERLPADWVVQPMLADFDFQVTTSEINPRSGKQCATISRTPGKHYGETFGSLQQQIDANIYRGKKIKLRAAIRTEVTGPGNQSYMWLRVMKKSNNMLYDSRLFFDNMADRPITTKEWNYYEIVGEVPMDADTIDYGFALVGDGKAWFDSVSLETIGH